MIYRVTYPMLSSYGRRDFATRAEADAFAAARRNSASAYQTIYAWRHVTVEEVAAA